MTNNPKTIQHYTSLLRSVADHDNARLLLRALAKFGEAGRQAAMAVADERFDFYLDDDLASVFGQVGGATHV